MSLRISALETASSVQSENERKRIAEIIDQIYPGFEFGVRSSNSVFEFGVILQSQLHAFSLYFFPYFEPAVSVQEYRTAVENRGKS